MEREATKRPAWAERVSGVMRNLPTVNGREAMEDIQYSMKLGQDDPGHVRHDQVKRMDMTTAKGRDSGACQVGKCDHRMRPMPLDGGGAVRRWGAAALIRPRCS